MSRDPRELIIGCIQSVVEQDNFYMDSTCDCANGIDEKMGACPNWEEILGRKMKVGLAKCLKELWDDHVGDVFGGLGGGLLLGAGLVGVGLLINSCLLYTSPSPRDS